MRWAATLGFALAVASGCSPGATPTQDPAQAVHIRNNSNRAVMVLVGDHILGTENPPPPTAVRPCGRELSLAIDRSDYLDDGRLLVMLAIDQSGMFDQALSTYEGDPASMSGTFSIAPIWSDGTLADQLPVYLTVHPDLTVDKASQWSTDSLPSCHPAF